jgi:uncharacterized membrane protein required for colicin V production
LIVDLTCVAIVVLCAVAGAWQGALAHLARLGSAVAGWAGARWLGPVLLPLFGHDLPQVVSAALASAAAFALCSVAGYLLIRGITYLAGLRRAVGKGTDRGVGALFGAIHAALVLWLILSAVSVLHRPVHLGRLHFDPRRSDLIGFAREHNALGLLRQR